jgi:hypothetical protein
MLASLAPWLHVIDSQFLGLFAAVLASEPVSYEDLKTREPALVKRSADVASQTNDRGQRKRGLDSVNDSPTVFNHLCFAAEHEHKGATGATDIMGLKPLVQY